MGEKPSDPLHKLLQAIYQALSKRNTLVSESSASLIFFFEGKKEIKKKSASLMIICFDISMSLRMLVP